MRNEIILVGGFLVVLLAGSSCYNYFFHQKINKSTKFQDFKKSLRQNEMTAFQNNSFW